MWVKVCGLTNVENALEVVAHRPDAIGLNFYHKSKRAIDLPTAKQIVCALPENVQPVGLFVNHSADDILQICDETGITMIQLHGDETPEFAAELTGLRIIRALRVNSDNLNTLLTDVPAWHDPKIDLFGILVDAQVDGAYGGTGHTAPWQLIADFYDRDSWPPLILAGGLTVENVQQAIEQVSPSGVDVASGVESSPGVKDPQLVERFINAARTASSQS